MRERRALWRRLDADAALDFPILEELRAEGYTDYLAMPLPFTDGRVQILSFASRAPLGFTHSQLADLEAILPGFALLVEVFESRRFTATLLETYLGRHTGERVLAGRITRGAGEIIPAALWYSDLRDFTATTAEIPPSEVLDLLGTFFDCMAGQVHAEDGEVLKFMGDGMLAIFPIRPDRVRKAACAAALRAAQAALAELDEVSRRRVAARQSPVRSGIALHFGEVVYGNIGARNRLDFTVIGSAVNLVARIENLCGRLGESLLFSRTFAESLDVPVESRGRFELKGLREAEEVFTVE
jgi:adenylate cyclase